MLFAPVNKRGGDTPSEFNCTHLGLFFYMFFIIESKIFNGKIGKCKYNLETGGVAQVVRAAES